MTSAVRRHERLHVPFVDLGPSHEALRDDLLAEIGRLIGTGAFTNGPQVREFEAAYASFCGTSHCVGVASGLNALRLGLIACALEPGDKVILPGQHVRSHR